MEALGPFLATMLHLVCAGGAIALGGWLLARRGGRGPATLAQAAALALTACWALAVLGFGPFAIVSGALLSFSYLAWLWTLYRLFAQDERDKHLAPIRPVVIALAFVELLQIALLAVLARSAGSPEALVAVTGLGSSLRLLFCIGALVLVHNLYAGASPAARQALGWPAAALALLWLYDLNLATVAYLSGSPPALLMALRAAIALLMVGILAIGAMRHDGNLSFRPSRSFAFQSFSLLLIGGYLLVMLLVWQGLAHLGGELARVIQAGFIALAGALALAILPSRRVRDWLRVVLTKHLFQHRYDYRSEWLRFTQTIGSAGPSAPPLGERIVQAVADITDSPCGLLLTPREEGGLALEARWQWPEIEVPAVAMDMAGARFFEDGQFILDLDEAVGDTALPVPDAARPEWLAQQPDAWALVPLVHFERLVGVVVLGRPPLARPLDWEDFDLLRVIGRQLASYLAEEATHEALGEAQRFDEFNRRIAFVMHDIKNLASQMSLLARNAEKHADKPEFRADMLLTLRSSAEKLQGLLERLGRYRSQGGEARQRVALQEILTTVASRYQGRHEVIVVDGDALSAMADPDALEQALVHLVQNAVDASPDWSPVFLGLYETGSHAVIEIVDSGSGMSPDFVRARLFKPFHSSKPGGFGIGAFEARELIRAMGGVLDVESREGLGTRFLVRLPLAGAPQSQMTEVA